jgi:hypothetical protein
METQPAMLDLTLSEFYAATMAQSGVDVTPPDIAKLAEARGTDPQLAELAKSVYDHSILDGVTYDDPAVRLDDAFKIAGAWLESRAALEADATKIAHAIRIAAETAVMQLIDEFGIDVEVDDAIKIAAFTHLPVLEEEKTSASGAGPAQPEAPSTADIMAQAAQQGYGPNSRIQASLAAAHKQNGGAGPLGYHPETMHALIGAAMTPHLDEGAHASHGAGIVDRYVPKEQTREFYHHAGEIASAAANKGEQLTADQIFSHARDKVNGVSDNKMLGFAQKNWKPLAAGGAALGLGAMYFMHKRKERQQREAYLADARRRAGIGQQNQQPMQAQTQQPQVR